MENRFLEAIKDRNLSIDINKILDELLKEDTKFRSVVKNTIKKMFLNELKKRDSFEDATDAFYCLADFLPDDMSVATILSNSLQDKEENTTFRKKVANKIQDLFLNDLKNHDSVSELTGIFTVLYSYLPKNTSIENMATKLLIEDKKIKEKLVKGLQSIILAQQDDTDSNLTKKLADSNVATEKSEKIEELFREYEVQKLLLHNIKDNLMDR